MEKVKRRNTATTTAITELLEKSKTALCEQDISEQLAVKADRATIFRVLNRLVEDGLAHKVVSDEGKSYFALCNKHCDAAHHHDNHYHFKCTKCMKVECIGGELKLKLPEGYKVEHTNLVLSGVCVRCN